MASLFRKRIAQKVFSMLQKKQELKVLSTPNVLSSFVKMNSLKTSEPQLILPWTKIQQVCDQPIKINPKELVRLLRNQGLPTAEGFINIELSESPYLRLIFTVDKHIFSKIVLVDICTNDDDFAKSSCFFEDIQKENIVVQCSIPSLGKNFHLSHFRTVIHSNFVANINKFVGHNVTKIAHVNDWGLDAAVLLTGYKKFKIRRIQNKNLFDLQEIMKAALFQYENDLKFKEESDVCYDKMKQGDISILSEWQELKQMCMKYYDSIFQRIGVNFDALHFDSACFRKSEEISNQLLDNNIFDKDTNITSCNELMDNAYINTTTSYHDFMLYNLSRYISAATELKNLYKFDRMLYISPSSQKDFFSTLFYLMKELDYEWVNELHHINLQLMNTFDSKRKKISIDTVLNQVKDGMIKKLHENLYLELNESLEEMAENLSISSLILSNMKHRRKVDYKLDWQDIISFKKDSAASFQLCSAGLKGLQGDSEFIFNTDIDLSPLLEPEAHYLIQQLARFDEMVFKSYVYLEPCLIFQYLSSLWYFTDKVTNTINLDIKADRLIVIKARLMLLSATLKVLNKGLLLLGITPLEKVYSSKPFIQSSSNKI